MNLHFRHMIYESISCVKQKKQKYTNANLLPASRHSKVTLKCPIYTRSFPLPLPSFGIAALAKLLFGIPAAVSMVFGHRR